MANPFAAERSALMLIDDQAGTMQIIKAIPIENSSRNTVVLAKMAKIFDMSVLMSSSQNDLVRRALISEFENLLPRTLRRHVPTTQGAATSENRNWSPQRSSLARGMEAVPGS